MSSHLPPQGPIRAVIVSPPPDLQTPLDHFRWYVTFMRRQQEKNQRPPVIAAPGPQEMMNLEDFLITLADVLLQHGHPKALQEDDLNEDGRVTEQIKSKIHQHVEDHPHQSSDDS